MQGDAVADRRHGEFTDTKVNIMAAAVFFCPCSRVGGKADGIGAFKIGGAAGEVGICRGYRAQGFIPRGTGCDTVAVFVSGQNSGNSLAGVELIPLRAFCGIFF